MARVIIDGYNLLLAQADDASPEAREGLLRELARYKGNRRIDLLVVFDSRTGTGNLERTPFPGVTVEYARGSADDAIVERVRRSTTPRDVLVVTSDRELTGRVRALGARTEDRDSFRQRDAHRRKSGGARLTDKTGPTSSEEIDYWLKEFENRETDDEW